MPRIVRAITHDVRFPTSRTGAGSDAMNPDPDYSAAYVVLETDAPGVAGHGLTFTIGRGNELCVGAIEALAPHVVGCTLEELTCDLRGMWRRLMPARQLRWLGPEKGVVHLATGALGWETPPKGGWRGSTGALVNAVWDILPRVEQKPIWKRSWICSPVQLPG